MIQKTIIEAYRQLPGTTSLGEFVSRYPQQEGLRDALTPIRDVGRWRWPTVEELCERLT